MASFAEQVRVAAPPERAWAVASDLARLGEWLTMHEAWRGEVPTDLQTGSRLTSVVNVKGLRNRVDWEVVSHDPPHRMSLVGKGVGGTDITLNLSVVASGAGSQVTFDVDFSGRLIRGPVGLGVKRALAGDVRRSADQLAALLHQPAD